MAAKNTRFIFVTGGVLSGLGKGITAAAIGKILKARGLKVNLQKLDPYLNVDAGTLNPAEHGECFVTKDGAETDLDLGHYERFLDIELTSNSSIMSGKLLSRLIREERRGKFLGKTVQVVPHFTDAIQQAVLDAAGDSDVHIVEIGGTIGDYEGLAFYEAIRELGVKLGTNRCLYVQVVYMPFLGTSKEIKTKPAQNATRELRAVGILPDILVARSDVFPENEQIKDKLSAFCGVPIEGVVVLPNAPSVYQVPLTLEDSGIAEYISKKLKLKTKKVNLKDWRRLVEVATSKELRTVDVGVVAKYMDNEDTYMSVFEAIRAAGWKHDAKVNIHWINAEKLDSKNLAKKIKTVDGIVVPGGFGARGMEGKIAAAQYAMKNKTPYLGLCLGLQMAVVAAARKRFGIAASSLELDPDCDHPIVSLMDEQKEIVDKGGTMRLGNYDCAIQPDTLAHKLYKSKEIVERHRHRYEVNNKYREVLEDAGMIFSGLSPDGKLVEMVELKDHPFFIASQFHPEFKSRPDVPHPLFDGFIAHIVKARYNGVNSRKAR